MHKFFKPQQEIDENKNEGMVVPEGELRKHDQPKTPKQVVLDALSGEVDHFEEKQRQIVRASEVFGEITPWADFEIGKKRLLRFCLITTVFVALLGVVSVIVNYNVLFDIQKFNNQYLLLSGNLATQNDRMKDLYDQSQELLTTINKGESQIKELFAELDKIRALGVASPDADGIVKGLGEKITDLSDSIKKNQAEYNAKYWGLKKLLDQLQVESIKIPQPTTTPQGNR